MGAIQGAVNGLIGTAAAGIAGVKHIEGQKAAAAEQEAIGKEQGLLAKSQYYEAKSQLNGLSVESEDTEAALKKSKAELDVLNAKRPGGKGNTKAALQEKRAKALTELEAAQRAFNELQDKIEGKKAMMARTEAIMKRTGTWGGVR